MCILYTLIVDVLAMMMFFFLWLNHIVRTLFMWNFGSLSNRRVKTTSCRVCFFPLGFRSSRRKLDGFELLVSRTKTSIQRITKSATMKSERILGICS